MAHYLDTSALAKLVVAEAESEALRAWVGASDGALVSCDLARTELLRSARRVAPDRMRRARQVLDGLMLLKVTPGVSSPRRASFRRSCLCWMRCI